VHFSRCCFIDISKYRIINQYVARFKKVNAELASTTRGLFDMCLQNIFVNFFYLYINTCNRRY